MPLPCQAAEQEQAPWNKSAQDTPKIPTHRTETAAAQPSAPRPAHSDYTLQSCCSLCQLVITYFIGN